jgi:hypothetical protein
MLTHSFKQCIDDSLTDRTRPGSLDTSSLRVLPDELVDTMMPSKMVVGCVRGKNHVSEVLKELLIEKESLREDKKIAQDSRNC